MGKPSAPPLKSVFKKPQPVNPNSLPFFSRIVEDIIVNVFSRLEEDPRHLARLACVCRRFHNVIKSSCYKRQCMKMVPTIVSELMQSPNQQELLGEPPGGWGVLQKLLVCCPGLRHTGVLLNCWDYGLEREIGCSADFELVDRDKVPKFFLDLEKEKAAASEKLLALAGERGDMGTSFENQSDSNKAETVKRTDALEVPEENTESRNLVVEKGKQSCCREKFGGEAAVAGLDTRLETGKISEQKDSPNDLVTFSIREAPGLVTNGAKSILKRKKWEGNGGEGLVKQMKKGGFHYHSKVMKDSWFHGSYRRLDGEGAFHDTRSSRSSERWRSRDRNGEESGTRGNNETERGNREEEPHLAKGVWILTREEGHKLLASRSVIEISLVLLLAKGSVYSR